MVEQWRVKDTIQQDKLQWAEYVVGKEYICIPNQSKEIIDAWKNTETLLTLSSHMEHVKTKE